MSSQTVDYPESLDVRPLTTWPGELTPDHLRRRAPYKATLRTTLFDLNRELRAIGADRGHPVLEVAIDRRHFRVDGRPMLRAVAEHPGIVLSLPRTDVGALRFACDQFDYWDDNLRAVVLTMEALRAVDRHGAVKANEQYKGFAAIEAPGPRAIGGGLSYDEAERLLFAAAEGVTPGEDLKLVARRAKANAHPDRHGGAREAWDRVEAALLVLGLAV